MGAISFDATDHVRLTHAINHALLCNLDDRAGQPRAQRAPTSTLLLRFAERLRHHLPGPSSTLSQPVDMQISGFQARVLFDAVVQYRAHLQAVADDPAGGNQRRYRALRDNDRFDPLMARMAPHIGA